MSDQESTNGLEKWKREFIKQKEVREKMLDDRYPEMEEYAENEADRVHRIMNTPAAWRKL